MTAAQRLRLVVALGAVNLVLAIVAFGLAGTLNVAPQTAVRTPAPSATAGPVAVGSPAPSSPGVGPTFVPGSTPPSPSSTPGPIATPATVAGGGTQKPPATTPPVVTPSAAPPTPVAPQPTPVAPQPTPVAPQPTAAPPTGAPPSQAPPVTEVTKPRPPCPGTVAGAPGHEKRDTGVSRPCRGGETKRMGTAGRGHAAAPHTAASHTAPIREAAPVGRVEERAKVRKLRRIRRGHGSRGR